MGLIIGSLFGGTAKTTTGARSFFGVSFLSIMFISMGAMPQLATTLMSRGCAAGCPTQHQHVFSLCCCRSVLLMLLCSGEQPHFTCNNTGLNTALPWCCRVFYKQRDSRFFAPGVYAYAMAITHVTTLPLTYPAAPCSHVPFPGKSLFKQQQALLLQMLACCFPSVSALSYMLRADSFRGCGVYSILLHSLLHCKSAVYKYTTCACLHTAAVQAQGACPALRSGVRFCTTHASCPTTNAACPTQVNYEREAGYYFTFLLVSRPAVPCFVILHCCCSRHHRAHVTLCMLQPFASLPTDLFFQCPQYGSHHAIHCLHCAKHGQRNGQW